MSAGHLPRGMYRGPAGPRWTSQRELQGPSSRQHPSTCPARPAGFQNTQRLSAWLPQEGQLGASTCSVLGLHPCCLGSQRTTSSSPSLSPKPASLQDHALGLHRLQAHWPHTCLSLHLPGGWWAGPQGQESSQTALSQGPFPRGGELRHQDRGPMAEDCRTETPGGLEVGCCRGRGDLGGPAEGACHPPTLCLPLGTSSGAQPECKHRTQ